MADLKIPNLNIKSDKYIFKKKLNLRRKSKRRLFYESAFMFALSLFLIYINFLIPNKNSLFQNIPVNFKKAIMSILDIFSNLYEIGLVLFIFISNVLIVLLLIGSFYRIFRIAKRKTKFINYK